MEILVVGLNHSTAPVAIREKITFPEETDGHVSLSVVHASGVEEAVILSTCNRGEVIAATEEPDRGMDALVETIGRIHNLSHEDFFDYLYLLRGPEAVRHVFRVASSLDSMVLGEPQILGQVKDGYRRAAKVNATGPILNRLLHRAFFTAKRVRNETGVGKAAVSVAYVAVELAKKILGDLHKKQVLLIGAGEMAELAARHLATQVERPIVVTNRTYENACTLAGELRGSAVRMEEVQGALIDADVVITSTASCDPIINRPLMKTVLAKRRYRPVFLIDIAIPRDVDPAVNDIDSVYLFNIDDLQSVVEENIGERKQEALRGENIVNEEVLKFMRWMETLEATPTIIALKEKLEQIREGELNRLNGKLSRLGDDEREAVEMLTRSIINKIAHDPIAFLKRTESRSRRNVYLDIAQRLFGLDGLSTPSREEKGEPAEE